MAIHVLAVDHTAGIEPFRKKFAALAADPEIRLTVLAPDRWVENYRVIRAVAGGAGPYRIRTGRVGWPGYENRGFFVSGLGAAIRHVRPDILHLWEEPFSVITLQALWHAALWAPRAKVIFFSSDNLSRNFRYGYRPSWFYARVERLAHRQCAAATAVSAEVADVLRAKGFERPVEIIPHGLDPSDYAASGASEAEAMGRRAAAGEVRARFGLDPPMIGFVGRMLRQKGVDTLLRAVALMPEPRPSLVLVGDGPDRASFVSLAEELGILRSTRFLPAVPHDRVPSVLAAIDVLVLPSRTTPRWKEQFGRVLVEGMAAGCVVLGSSSGAIPEVLGEAGIVFPEGDAERLATELQRVLASPEWARELRIRGWRRARESYSWEAVAARVLGLYRRLLSAA